MKTKRIARLRVCASCEWIYKFEIKTTCPLCGFVSYGAHSVYGKRCYAFQETQEPWFNKKLDERRSELWEFIGLQQECKIRTKPLELKL